jgi:hypothetical protein
MAQQKSQLTQSPLEREIASFTRSVDLAERKARAENFTAAVIAVGDALRAMSVIMGVTIKTLDMVVKENKALRERVETLEKEGSTPSDSTNG